ncbi:MAG TPA: hypothetical protein VFS10_02960 [Pyrinomonadaceae bacterium]|nr:hypothetical protein [Pyrinomonadaceae bacterium]
MKNRSFLLLTFAALVFAPSVVVRAQAESPAPTVHTRPRTVGAAQQQQPSAPSLAAPAAQQTPAPKPSAPPANADAQPQSRPAATATTQPQTQAQSPATQMQPPATAAPSSASVPSLAPSAQPTTPAPSYVPLQPVQPLSVSKFRARVAEAQRLLKSRLSLTAMTPSLSFVTIAALDQDSSKIHQISVLKQTFLKRGAEVVLTSSEGMSLRLQIVRPNYVNTALVVSDLAGRQLTPLVVAYPIEKFGSFREMAYYTSAHPALVSPELVRQGQSYVRTMLDLAARRLKEKGKNISPELVDIAERLCVVEHVDHGRFRNEDRGRLYNEVFALFALNELDTYRYSVSSAGAGGMVQMIPSTYQMVRRMHPGVGLNPDFVAGMRNHGNALEAMLLYMQDTWNGLALNQQVLDAMAGSYATQPELVAAGYNSNPARLPLYIRRGGEGWRTLIPRETQMYLQIYKSVESLVKFKDRGKDID